MARRFKTTRIRIPYRRLPFKLLRGNVRIDFGMDNFCYIHTKNNKRVDLTKWMEKFNGKEIEIKVIVLNKKYEKTRKNR